MDIFATQIYHKATTRLTMPIKTKAAAPTAPRGGRRQLTIDEIIKEYYKYGKWTYEASVE
jgi:hypothetical protein